MLSLSGGAAKGAYEAGALYKLVNMLEAPDSHYDVISGVSVGSINAAGAGLFGPGEDKQMGDYLLGLWNNLTSESVWQFWNSSNPITGITDKGGFLDNSPLHHLLSGLISEKDNKFKKRVLVSANDVQTGSYVHFRLNDHNDTDLIASAILGSAAVPFVFPPENMTRFGLNHTLVDAGFTWNINMDSGIDECYKIDGIDHPSQIVVDVINLTPDILP